jgi:alpha-methylacyl-CoA racemase
MLTGDVRDSMVAILTPIHRCLEIYQTRADTFGRLRQEGWWTDTRGENLADGGAPYYRTYETSEGKFVAGGAMEPQFYTALIEGLGLSGNSLPDQNDRVHWPAPRKRFAAIFRSLSSEQWVEVFDGRDACVTPVLSVDEAPVHLHMKARNTFTPFDGALHPSPAPRFSRTPASLRRPAPCSENAEEILAEGQVNDTESAPAASVENRPIRPW